MTYIVNDKCIKCKLTDCVDVCPVDCFYEGKNMLVIKPDECIDCGVCEPECPLEAIKADTEEGSEKWLETNKNYSEIWPNINKRKDPPQDWKNLKMKKINLKNILKKTFNKPSKKTKISKSKTIKKKKEKKIKKKKIIKSKILLCIQNME